jgi:hypothetical protein
MLVRSRAVSAGVALVAIVACGGTTSSVEGPPAETSGGAGNGSDTSSGSGTGSGSDSEDRDGGGPGSRLDAGRDARAPNDEACPKTFSAPPGNCKLGTRCEYDEGTCQCVVRCGGAPPPPEEDTSQWTCTKKRNDGCPDERPTAGAACKGNLDCRYGDCCFQTFTCINGKWASGGAVCPP